MIYNAYKVESLKGGVALLTDTIKVALLGNTYTQNIDTDVYFSDISSHEITGTGYTSGGTEITGKTVTQDNTDNEGVFDGNDVSWPNSTITARYAVIYKDTGVASTSPLINCIDFGGDKSSLNEAFSIQWASEGILNAN